MGSLSDIKRRLTSVRQTRRITGAMKTVSVAKMQKASEQYEKSRAYTELLSRVMRAVMPSDSDNNIYFKRLDIDRELIIVLSTDRGLCGGFDNELIKLASEQANENALIMPIGKAAEERFKSGENVITKFARSYSAEHAVAESIAKEIILLYGTTVGCVKIVYGEMTSHAAYKPAFKTILPIERTDASSTETISVFEPSEKEILNTVVPLYISSAVYGAIVNNTVAEHCARRAAMSAATDSADRLIDTLSVEYNRARQATVTEQIIEIIGSTSALENNGKLD